jgi:hypothetical protein
MEGINLEVECGMEAWKVLTSDGISNKSGGVNLAVIHGYQLLLTLSQL